MNNSESFTSMLERLAKLTEALELLVKKRKALGEYNADAADILAIAQIELLLTQTLTSLINHILGRP